MSLAVVREALEQAPLLKPKDVARRLSISLSQVYALARKGDIRVLRIGALVRVEASELERYIAAARAS